MAITLVAGPSHSPALPLTLIAFKGCEVGWGQGMLNCKVPQKSTNKLGAKMGSRFATCAATIFGALLLQPAPIQAQTVSYGVTAVGGNVWQYDYTITNTSPTLIFDQVTIYFDYSSYSFID
ncbi:MAG: hypothetical protein Q8N44_19840, partial [Rubrivivax sp.]|nr:hypothetical protein [Rubrivivax sp.]